MKMYFIMFQFTEGQCEEPIWNPRHDGGGGANFAPPPSFPPGMRKRNDAEQRNLAYRILDQFYTSQHIFKV